MFLIRYWQSLSNNLPGDHRMSHSKVTPKSLLLFDNLPSHQLQEWLHPIIKTFNFSPNHWFKCFHCLLKYLKILTGDTLSYINVFLIKYLNVKNMVTFSGFCNFCAYDGFSTSNGTNGFTNDNIASAS